MPASCQVPAQTGPDSQFQVVAGVRQVGMNEDDVAWLREDADVWPDRAGYRTLRTFVTECARQQSSRALCQTDPGNNRRLTSEELASGRPAGRQRQQEDLWLPRQEG